MHHIPLDRPRSNDGDFDHEVVEIPRAQTRQHRHLRARFDLKDPDGVGVADHVVDERVFGGDCVELIAGKRRRDGETERRSGN